MTHLLTPENPALPSSTPELDRFAVTLPLPGWAVILSALSSYSNQLQNYLASSNPTPSQIEFAESQINACASLADAIETSTSPTSPTS